MILAGDEFGHSQQGNNNAYCQDNELAWIDWEGITDGGYTLADFCCKLLALRSALPVLRRNRFFTGQHNETIGVKDATWLTPAAAEMTEAQWTDPSAKCLGVILDGRAQTSGIKRPASDPTVLIVLNSHYDVVRFKLPEVVGGTNWELLIDTNLPMAEVTPFDFGREYDVTGRSLLLFALRPSAVRRTLRLAHEALTSAVVKRVEAARAATVEAKPEIETKPRRRQKTR
jgi:isoamylase